MTSRVRTDASRAAAGLRTVVGGRPAGMVRTLSGLRTGGFSFAGVLAGAAARFPDTVALVDAAGPVTARELEAAADDVARRVRAALADGGAGQRYERADRTARAVPPAVGVQVGDHRGFVAAVAGVLRAGADAVLIGPRTGSAALARVVSEQRLVLLVRESDPWDGAGGLVVGPPPADSPASGSASGPAATSTWRAPSVPPSRARRTARAPRVVLLTAGTTGPPTVAPVAARRVTTDRLLPQLGLLGVSGIRAGRPLLVLTPLFHGHGFAFLTAGLLVGAPVVVVGARTGAEICAAAAGHAAGVVTGVPVHLQRLADHLAADHAPGALRCPHAPAPERVVSGSARLCPGVVRTLTAHLGDVVVDIFGSTQTGALTVATPADLRAAPGTVGRPAPGVRLAVVDDDGRPCPRGTPGRVVLREGLAGHGRVIPSGDRGVLGRDGRLVLLGRADEVVVCGGENVRPDEVAEFLAAQPGVRAAAVGPVPDAEYGTRLVADVVLEAGGPLAPGSAADVLREAVRAGLAPHAVPRSVRVVEDLRRSAVGKPLPPVAADDEPAYSPSAQPSGSARAAASAGPHEPGL